MSFYDVDGKLITKNQAFKDISIIISYRKYLKINVIFFLNSSSVITSSEYKPHFCNIDETFRRCDSMWRHIKLITDIFS